MSEIIIPTPQEEEENINYQPTEKDEEKFLLMYHMNVQPSEVDAMSDDYRKWIIARFLMQKNMEKEVMERHRIMSQIGPNLKLTT